MKHTLLLVSAAVLIAPPGTYARTWHVEPDGTGQAITIQAGIDSAAAGDTVLVAEGCYEGEGNYNIDFKGKSIVVRSEGGAAIGDCSLFALLGVPDSRSLYAMPWEEVCRRFDALVRERQLSRGTEGGSAFPMIGFHFHSGEDTTAVLENFMTLGCSPAILIENSSPKVLNTRCISDRAVDEYIHCENSGAIIRDNRLWPMFGGVGIRCIASHALIEGNTQHSDWGMKFYCDSDSSTIVNNSTGGHSSGALGTQIYCLNSCNKLRGNQIECIEYNTICIRCVGGIYEITDNILEAGTGGVEVLLDSCRTIIEDNYFRTGYTGIEANGGSHTIHGNTIRDQQDPCGWLSGKGIILRYIDSTTTVSNNTLYQDDYGIVCDNASPVISGNIIAFNSAGIRCESSSPFIFGNTIAFNLGQYPDEEAPESGFGILCSESSPVIENCLIAFNGMYSFSPWAYGIYCADESSTPSIRNCDVFGNAAGEYFGIPDQTGLNGNFSLEPFFCDPHNLEFTLHALSPCLPRHNPYGIACGLIGALGQGCDFIATLLQRFEAAYHDASIQLDWTVTDAVDLSRFDIHRASAPDWRFAPIASPRVEGGGVSFRFRDTDVSPEAAYRYRVMILEETEPQLLFETDAIDVPALPLSLHQNYPNPFNPATRISYYLPADDRVILDVYDVSGRRIVRLADEPQKRGMHEIDWNGTNAEDAPVGSGIYFYRLIAGKQSISRKMILLR